jgi:hypothetical protein
MILCAVVGLPGTAFAQLEMSADALRRCAVIERGIERLECYDSVVGALDADSASAPSSATMPPNAEAADPDTAGARDADAVDSFGAELIRDDGDDRGVEEIQSRIVGEFDGWRGGTIFRLENGQVWRQLDQSRYVYRVDSPVVTISRGAFGSYRLRVEGRNRSVSVRRIE